MAKIPKQHACATISDSEGDLITPTYRAGVHQITLQNTHTEGEPVQLFMHNGTTSFRFFNETVPAGETVELQYNGFGRIIPVGSKIRGVTTTASKINIIADGWEETA
jgi:YD repeat-containing protein